MNENVKYSLMSKLVLQYKKYNLVTIMSFSVDQAFNIMSQYKDINPGLFNRKQIYNKSKKIIKNILKFHNKKDIMKFTSKSLIRQYVLNMYHINLDNSTSKNKIIDAILNSYTVDNYLNKKINFKLKVDNK